MVSTLARMWETVVFVLAAFHVLSTVNGSYLRTPDNVKCFCSSDAAALNASQLFDDRIDNGALWKREDEQSPLPSCSDMLDLLSNHTCVVCRDGQVFAVCQNLSEHADLRLEGSSGHIGISTCACDQLPKKAEVPMPAPTTAPPAPTPAGNKLCWLILPVVLFVILVVIFIMYWRNREPEDRRDPEAAAMTTCLNNVPVRDVMNAEEMSNGHV